MYTILILQKGKEYFNIVDLNNKTEWIKKLLYCNATIIHDKYSQPYFICS